MSQHCPLGKDAGPSGNIWLLCSQMIWHVGIQTIPTLFPVCSWQPSPPHLLPTVNTFKGNQR